MHKLVKKIIINFVLLIVIGAGLFFLFSRETAAAILALIILLSGQIMFLTSRIRVNHPSPDPEATTYDLPIKTKPDKPITQVKKQAVAENHIDPGVFSTFQQNLDQSHKSAPEEPPKDKPENNKKEEEVVVSISPQAKKPTTYSRPSQADQIQMSMEKARQKERKTKQVKKAAPPLPTKEIKKPVVSIPVEPMEAASSLGSIFDDVQDPLSIAAADKIIPASSKINQAADKAAAPHKKVAKQEKQTNSEANKPLASREILTSDDLIPEPENSQKEEEMMLSIAKNAYQDQKIKESLNILIQWLSGVRKDNINFNPSLEFMKFKGNCEFDLKLYEDSAKSWRQIFETRVKAGQDEFLPLLEDIIDRFSKVEQHPLALTFFFTALTQYQKQKKFPQMDLIYTGIEKAYFLKQDWDRLIHTYQNHLVIKKNLEDFEGQLNLLNLLGKLLYDRGDSDGSKVCYEQSMEIKEVLQSNP